MLDFASMMSKQTTCAILLLIAAAGARTLTQVAAMPPYAGLDEVYHVARVSFLTNERRNPTVIEDSVPAYLHHSQHIPGSLPHFLAASRTWPQYVDSLEHPLTDDPVPLEARVSYLTPNYQAQHPSLYYFLASTVTDHNGATTPLQQLRHLRLLSAILATVAIAATAYLGVIVFGPRGVFFVIALPFLPNWQTLLTRVSNDALACALVAIALALSFRAPRGFLVLAEALAWAGALATKLYTWPVLVILPFLWHRQQARWRRILVVGAACVVSVVGVAVDLDRRTGVPVGLQGYESHATYRGSYLDVEFVEMLKITIASGIWMAGEHGNALTSIGMMLYVLPPLVLVIPLLRRPNKDERFWLRLCVAALLAFAMAQIVHAFPHIRNAVATGNTMPAAGKEGWYWFLLAPVFVTLLGGYLCRTLPLRALSALLLWIASWDLIITHGALFRDYAGLTNAEAGSALFRWGPAPQLSVDSYERLQLVAVGPFTGSIPIMYAASLGLAAFAVVLLVREAEWNSRVIRGGGPTSSVVAEPSS
jgi:hypothetical protein